ncbi:MAG: NAD(P)/FAD-dependent oxidoreductase [Chthoniobacteraceae bacterium]
MNSNPHPKIIIVGGGFGGLSAAKELADKPVDVLLVDRANHHLFQPLLYQVATAGLSPSDIAQPIRSILRDAGNVTVVLEDVRQIDADKKQIVTAHRRYDYDYLILAAGATHSYFGNDGWEKFAPGLKTIEDALEIRRRLLMAFEVAEKTTDEAERAAAMTFVVVGGGPTGVEMAGAIAETARFTLHKNFRHIDPSKAQVILIDAAPRVLPTFAPDLSEKAKQRLEKMHVQVRCSTKVKNVGHEEIELEGETIHARTIVWAAGNSASPLGKSLGVQLDRAGRVILNNDLTIPAHPEIQVIGDMSSLNGKDGKPLPGVSPVAMQQGRHAAANILAMINGQKPSPFKYFDKGSMATIGRNSAVADLGFIRFGGYIAWLAWLFIHLIFLIGLRNRIAVLFHWVWAYFTFSKGSRLITGIPSEKQ